MAILPKPSAIIKKPDTKIDHLNETINCEEDKFEVQTREIAHKELRCMLISAAVTVVIILLGCVRLYYDVYPRTFPTRRYQGYCSIPIPNDLKMVNPELNNMVQLHWTTDDVQYIATNADSRPDELLDALREELDLADHVERISVINNGHRVDFIHDFTDNTTGIVDDERCFVMELEPELVLSPELFIAGLQSGAPFDVSRVRSRLRAHAVARGAAALPAGARAACAARPVYRLQPRAARPAPRLQRRAAPRRRAGAEAPHDYVHFAGRHVQEIQIDNLAEILEHERRGEA